MTISAMLLGVAQDGGLPQPGCACLNCAAARANPALRQQVVCLGVTDAAVTLIHPNHTNPLWRAGAERAWMEARGLRVGALGDGWEL